MRVCPKNHFTSLRVAGPNVLSHVPTTVARASSGGIVAGCPPSQSAVVTHLGREDVQTPSLCPRIRSPRTPSTVITLGDRGVVPPQVFPGAGS